MISQSPEEDFEASSLSLTDYCAVIAVKNPTDGELVLDVHLPYEDLALMLDIIDALTELTQAVSVRVIRDGLAGAMEAMGGEGG